MSVKEQIIRMMQEAGHGFVTACEEADRVIQDFLSSESPQRTYFITNGGSFTLKRNETWSDV